MTTVTAEYDRISMHGIRRDILRAQVAQLSLSLQEATIPPAASNAAYEAAFIAALARARVAYPGVRTVAFGDLYLEDVRAYREQFLAPLGWQPLFPLWGLNTSSPARQFVEDKFQAVVCCVDSTQLAPDFAGRDFDTAFLDTLPPSVDPRGERGEFHTCVYGGPIFGQALVLERGERVLRDGRFEYCDLRLRAPDEDVAA